MSSTFAGSEGRRCRNPGFLDPSEPVSRSLGTKTGGASRLASAQCGRTDGPPPRILGAQFCELELVSYVTRISRRVRSHWTHPVRSFAIAIRHRPSRGSPYEQAYPRFAFPFPFRRRAAVQSRLADSRIQPFGRQRGRGSQRRRPPIEPSRWARPMGLSYSRAPHSRFVQVVGCQITLWGGDCCLAAARIGCGRNDSWLFRRGFEELEAP